MVHHRERSGGPSERHGVRLMLVALMLTTVIMLTGCGTGITGQAAVGADGRPCAEVHAELDEANRVRAGTSGGGPEGREAIETIRRVIEERSDRCHDEQTILSATDVVPAGMADAAHRVADTCGSVTTGMVELMDPDSEPADHPRDALAEARGRSAPGLWPDGEPTRSAEDADGVSFDLYDDGRYRGWVMFEEVEGGWSARFATSRPPRTVSSEPTVPATANHEAVVATLIAGTSNCMVPGQPERWRACEKSTMADTGVGRAFGARCRLGARRPCGRSSAATGRVR